MATTSSPDSIIDLFGADPPSNWGKWGPDDEIGSLNYLTPAEALRGAREVKSGRSFTLQLQMGRTDGPGDPVWPGREPIARTNVLDHGDWCAGGPHLPANPGGLRYSDDVATMSLQGSTQYDALGHAWYDDKLWNGFDAATTVGKMRKASVLPIAEHGIVGRGVLIDMARHRNKACLDKGEAFSHEDLLEAAHAQGVTIEKRDILLIRTGWMAQWYRSTPEVFFDKFVEPGLTYSPELVRWFQQMEIPNLVTDTIANEVTFNPETGFVLPLHLALMRNLGVLFTEMAWLEDLADACVESGRYSCLYTAAPLKVVGGTGAPVNPIAIV